MSADGEIEEAETLERRTLAALLAINALMFVAVAIAGLVGDSAALLADSLDNLADASVYGLAFHAVGRVWRLKARAARFAGMLLIALGAGVLIETGRRFVQGSDPASVLMIAMGTAALVANVACVVLIARHRRGEIHMRASWIFATNDVIANAGVILSGVLVMVLGSRFPDLVIGGIIALVVLGGGVRILREARALEAAPTAAGTEQQG